MPGRTGPPGQVVCQHLTIVWEIINYFSAMFARDRLDPKEILVKLVCQDLKAFLDFKLVEIDLQIRRTVSGYCYQCSNYN